MKGLYSRLVTIIALIFVSSFIYAAVGSVRAQITSLPAVSFSVDKESISEVIPLLPGPVQTTFISASQQKAGQEILFGADKSHYFSINGYQGMTVNMSYSESEYVLTDADGNEVIFKPEALLQTCTVGVDCDKVFIFGRLKIDGADPNAVYSGIIVITRDYI
jgi:hypothetical protein